eukprot:1921664-Rhodomonas_salina.2
MSDKETPTPARRSGASVLGSDYCFVLLQTAETQLGPGLKPSSIPRLKLIRRKRWKAQTQRGRTEHCAQLQRAVSYLSRGPHTCKGGCR